MAKLDGKVAVVTGASSGIGEASAEALAAQGAAVVVAARREDRLTDLVGRIRGGGGRVLAAVCDVTDESQAHGLIRKAEEEFGSVDILVNNAGVMLLSNVGKGLSDEWRQMFDVNVMGLLYATDAAIEVMKRQGGGHLVNISSRRRQEGHPRLERGLRRVQVRRRRHLGGPAAGAPARQHKGHHHRAGCRRDRTDDPHHRRRRQREPRRPAEPGDLAGRRHRQRRHLRRHPAGARERKRDPDPTHPTARVARSGFAYACQHARLSLVSTLRLTPSLVSTAPPSGRRLVRKSSWGVATSVQPYRRGRRFVCTLQSRGLNPKS